MSDTEPQYRCNDCGVDVLAAGEWYMAGADIWNRQLGLSWSDNLCIGCLEQRLGRRVSFPEVGPASSRRNNPTSARLLDRLGHKSEPRRKKRCADSFGVGLRNLSVFLSDCAPADLSGCLKLKLDQTNAKTV
jgi:hypothetical protein